MGLKNYMYKILVKSRMNSLVNHKEKLLIKKEKIEDEINNIESLIKLSGVKLDVKKPKKSNNSFI